MKSGRFKVVDNTKKVKAELDAEFVKRVTMACLVAQAGVKLSAPTGDSGELRDKIDFEVSHVGTKIIGAVGSPLMYAPYVEFGTGEFAENGQGRKGGWVYKTPDGKWHFTLGMKPRPFMREGFRQTKDEVLKILGRFIKK